MCRIGWWLARDIVSVGSAAGTCRCTTIEGHRRFRQLAHLFHGLLFQCPIVVAVIGMPRGSTSLQPALSFLSTMGFGGLAFLKDALLFVRHVTGALLLGLPVHLRNFPGTVKEPFPAGRHVGEGRHGMNLGELVVLAKGDRFDRRRGRRGHGTVVIILIVIVLCCLNSSP